MADTWEDLKAYLRTGDEDDVFVERCFNDATLLVETYVGEEKFVPEGIMDLAIQVTGRDLYAFRDTPQGISQFSDMNAAPIRVARDPLTAAKPILRRYVIGIA